MQSADSNSKGTETLKTSVADEKRSNAPHARKAVDPADMRSICLPVYVYNCPIKSLAEQLVNKWTHARAADIFEDLRFQLITDCSDDDSRSDDVTVEDESASRRRRKKTLRLVRGFFMWCQETVQCSKYDVHSSSDGERRRISDDGVYGNQTDLKQHCTMVAETFFRSFVNCEYSALIQAIIVIRCALPRNIIIMASFKTREACFSWQACSRACDRVSQ